MQLGSPPLKDLEASLKVLRSAFASIFKLRCANTLRHVASDLLPVAEERSDVEYQRLFGNKFLMAMVEDSDDFEKVEKFAWLSSGPY